MATKMEGKYIVTVETNQGEEVICYLKPKKTVGTLEECNQWVEENLLNFHWCKYRVYKLELIHGQEVKP